MQDQLKELFKDIPETIQPLTEMNLPNEPIPIYNGSFTIKNKDSELSLIGKIELQWQPDVEVKFYAEIATNQTPQGIEHQLYNVFVEGNFLGEARTVFGYHDGKYHADGEIENAVWGDKTIAVEKVIFSIPNLRDFIGEPVKTNGGGISITKGRLFFEDSEYSIKVDQLGNYKELDKKVDASGGFILLYSGELRKKKGNISHKESEDILWAFGAFLSFLNGRQVAPMFIGGTFENKVIWQHFIGARTDSYRTSLSWPRRTNIDGLTQIWPVFKDIWKTESGEKFLSLAIHWYVRANNGFAYCEDAIIFTQVALELIYNWLIIETKKMIIGRDSENISASNKLRILISSFSGSLSIPKGLSHLIAYANSSKEIIDGPEAFVQMRNMIVHPQEEKRKKYSKIAPHAKVEALRLGLWYVELSMLYILKFQEGYRNRCFISDHTKIEQYVPWRHTTI